MRSQYWDGCKGLAIIAVIAIHSCVDTEKFLSQSLNWHFGLIFRQFVNFAVPLFFAMSGYFSLPVKDESNRVNWLEFYQRRAIRIIIPYLIWTSIFILLFNREHVFSSTDLFKDFGCGMGVFVGYYTIVLIQYFALLPAILLIRSRIGHVAVMVGISTLGLMYSYYTRINFPTMELSQFPYDALLFFVWYPFFHLGIYARRFGFENINVRLLLSGLVIAIVLAILEAELLAYSGFYSIGSSQIKVSSFLVSILIFIMVVRIQSNIVTASKESNFVAKLGQHSYIIYLTHLVFIGAIQSRLHRYENIYSWQPVYIALSVVLTIAFCALLLFGIKAIVPKRFHIYLGM